MTLCKVKINIYMGANSTIFINFAMLLGNVQLFISVVQCFRIQGYNYSNVSKYAVN